MTAERFQDGTGSDRAETEIRILLTGARSAFIGPNVIEERYRTAVTTIFVGLEADVLLRCTDAFGARERKSAILAIPPDTACEIEAVGQVAILFTDALRDDCSEIDLGGDEQRIAQLRRDLSEDPMDAGPEVFLHKVFTSAEVTSRQLTRQDMVRVVSEIGRHPEAFPTVDRAAQIAGLSPARFQHVFSETIGVPFRRYRQWRRMGQIVRALANGDSLTEAAYAAGFSNSAHLSAAFKEMFGVRPSVLLGRQVKYCLSEAEFDHGSSTRIADK